MGVSVVVVWVEGAVSMGGDEVFGPGEQLRSDWSGGVTMAPRLPEACSIPRVRA